MVKYACDYDEGLGALGKTTFETTSFFATGFFVKNCPNQK